MKCNSCEMIIKKNDRVILDENGIIQCLECAKHSKNIVFDEENVFEFKGEEK